MAYLTYWLFQRYKRHACHPRVSENTRLLLNPYFLHNNLSILFLILTTLVWHLFPVCPSLERNPSSVALSEVSFMFFFTFKLCYLCQRRNVSSFMAVGWFVRMITTKLLNSFRLNLYGRWDMARILDPINFWYGSELRDRSGNFPHFLYHCDIRGFFSRFLLISQWIMHGS